MKKIKAAKLILDYNLYPRVTIDSQHTSYMVESLKAGLELPPIIVDEKSLRVIDGFHRVTATLRHNKNETIMAIFKKYKSETEMFVDAMKYNATHGRTLTQYDRAHCILRAEDLSIDLDTTAKALSISLDKVKELRTRRVGELILTGRIKRKAKGTFSNIQLKRTIQHKAGKVLTKQQVEVNSKLSGMGQSFYVNQIIMLIESKLLNTKNKRLIEKLSHLYSLLDDMFTPKEKSSAK